MPGGIKAFDVTHLQRAAVGFGQLNQLAGFGKRARDRLFHQDMNTATQAPYADLVVQKGRSRNDYAIDVPLPLTIVIDGIDIQLRLNQAARLRARIGDNLRTHKLDLRQAVSREYGQDAHLR